MSCAAPKPFLPPHTSPQAGSWRTAIDTLNSATNLYLLTFGAVHVLLPCTLCCSSLTPPAAGWELAYNHCHSKQRNKPVLTNFWGCARAAAVYFLLLFPHPAGWELAYNHYVDFAAADLGWTQECHTRNIETISSVTQ